MLEDVQTLNTILKIIIGIGSLLVTAFVYQINQTRRLENRLTTSEIRIQNLDKTINKDIAEMKAMLQSYFDILTDLRLHVSQIQGENSARNAKDRRSSN